MRGFVAYTESFTIQKYRTVTFCHTPNVFVAILMMQAEHIIKQRAEEHVTPKYASTTIFYI